MRKTEVLFKQHMGRMIQLQWFVKGKVKPRPTTTEEILKNHGYEVIDVEEFLSSPKKKEELKIIGYCDRELPKDKNHPNYKHEPCFTYRNNDVLIEGLEQAKALTNTVEICNGLPESLIEIENSLTVPDETHLDIQRRIKLCCMFEATQGKLPKKKDPLRPAWVFPREYGIPETKRNDLLCKNLTMICEQFSKNVNSKGVILDAFFSTPIKAHNKKIQFELTNELVVTTNKKLKAMAEPSSAYGVQVPEMGPVDCTISLRPLNFYELQNIYSPGSNSKWPFVQTACLHFNHTQVKSITEEEITESQIESRSLMNGFTVAAAQAHSLFGNDIKKLPEPITVPVVQTDGKTFHFSVFQLNTLDLDKNSEIKNIFWNSPRTPLYSECQYVRGRPILKEYNPDVIRRFISFYNIE